MEHTPGQRHMSHMYPLYPGNAITPRRTPGLAKAARVSLERRLAAGGAYTGWSRAWAINFWARLLDGDKAWESLSMLMQHSTGPNLFDTHPAGKSWMFQIDGNFGGDGGDRGDAAAEPRRRESFSARAAGGWPSGSVKGLRARGGVTVDLTWANGKATGAVLTAATAGVHPLRAPQGQRIAGDAKVRLEPGRPYRVSFV